MPGLINLDFADVQTVMTDKGIAHIGIGSSTGDEKAIEAVKEAISSPLLDTTIDGATHVIINISGDVSLVEANEAASYIQELAGENANIIFGAVYDDTVQDSATITVIATGIEDVDVNNAMAGFSNKISTAKPLVKPTYNFSNSTSSVTKNTTSMNTANISKNNIGYLMLGLKHAEPVVPTVSEKDLSIPTFLEKIKSNVVILKYIHYDIIKNLLVG